MHSWCHLSLCEIPAQWQITTDTTNPQFIFLAVDNDSRDLLVHEDEYRSEKCWQDRSKYPVPPDVKWVHEPATHRRRRLIQHTCTLYRTFSHDIRTAASSHNYALEMSANTAYMWWRSVVVSTLASINVVNRHWARLVLGRVTACGRVNHLGM